MESTETKTWIGVEISPVERRVYNDIPHQQSENPDSHEAHQDNDSADTEDDFRGFREEEIIENNDDQEQLKERRLPGRPKILRTGRPGRPRKIFNVDNARIVFEEHLECAYNTEILLKEALAGNDADD